MLESTTAPNTPTFSASTRPRICELTGASQGREAIAVANRIYCEEHLGRTWDQGRALFDPEPGSPRARVYGAVVGEAIVATAVLHLPGPEGTRRLPIEAHYDCGPMWQRGLRVGQVTHSACVPRWRGLGLGEAVWRRALEDAARAGYRDLLCLAATEVCEPGRITQAMGVLTRAGLDEPRFTLRLREAGGRRAQAPARDDEGGDSAASLPRLIAHYCRAGLRRCGPPIYMANFRMYDLPMCLSLGE